MPAAQPKHKMTNRTQIQFAPEQPTRLKQHIIEIEIFQSIFHRNKFGSALDDPRLNTGFWSRDFIAASTAAGLRYLPPTFGIRFGIPMPKHWSKLHRSFMVGKPADGAFELNGCVSFIVAAFVRYGRAEQSAAPEILFADMVWTDKPNIIIFVPERDGHWLFRCFQKCFG